MGLSTNGIRQIPFDRPDREENFKKTRYFERERQVTQLCQDWCAQMEKDTPDSADLITFKTMAQVTQSQIYWHRTASPKIINSEGFDSLIRAKKYLQHDVLSSIFNKYPEYKIIADEIFFFKNQWQERNRIMANNIIKAAKEYP